MLERLSRGRRNLALLAIGFLALWFVWTIRAVVNPLLVGYLFAYVLHPIVLRIRGKRLSHRAAVNLTFAVGGLLALVIALVAFVQTRALVVDVVTNPDVRERIVEKWGEARAWLVEQELVDPGELPRAAQLDEVLAGVLEEAKGRLLQYWETHQEEAGDAALKAGRMGVAATVGIFNEVKRLLATFFELGGMLVLIPLYAYYLLFELGRLHGFVARYVPHRERERVVRVGGQIGEVLANFFRGRLLVCLLKGGLLTVGLWLAGIPYSFLIGMGSGFLSLIPVFGPALGFVGAFVLGALEYSLLSTLIRTALVFGVAELLEGYVLIPKILGDSLGLHPLVVLFALLAGGAALGLFGVLVALPLTASIVILVKEFVLPSLERFADEDDGDSPIVLADGDRR